MATTSEVTLRIGANSEALSQGLRQGSKAVDSFAGKTRATFTRLGTALQGAADKLVTPMTGMLMGGGFAVAMKNVGDLSQSLMYYSMAAHKSDADTAKFREDLHQMAIQTGVDANTILAGVSRIGEVTGDFAFAEDMGMVLSKAAKASGSSVEELASVASSMKVSMGWGAEQISQAFNSLIIQGDQGSYTLQKFAAEGKALLAAASSFGIKSQEQFSSFGAYLQVMNTSIKSEAELTTSVSALFSELTSKSDKLKKIGVNVFDKDKNYRDLDDIMNELMKATGARMDRITALFGDSARKALVPVMNEYKNGNKTLKAITESGIEGMGNTDALDERFKKTANDFNTNIGKMKAAATQFMDSNLAAPVEKLSSALGYLAEHQHLVKAGFMAITVAAGAMAAVKIGTLGNQVRAFGRDLANIWKKKDASDNPAAPTPFDAGVQKVFVTNMPGSGIPGVGGEAPVQGPTTPNPLTPEIRRTTSTFTRLRGGMNTLLGTNIGFGALSVATGWAIGKITEAGNLLIDWMDARKSAMETSRQMVANNQKGFREKYGDNAARWAEKYDETLLAIQEEETSLFVNQGKVDKLYQDLRLYSEKMKTTISANKNGAGASAEQYMNAMKVDPQKFLPTQNFNINITPEAATVSTNSGKVPNTKVTRQNVPTWGRS